MASARIAPSAPKRAPPFSRSLEAAAADNDNDAADDYDGRNPTIITIVTIAFGLARNRSHLSLALSLSHSLALSLSLPRWLDLSLSKLSSRAQSPLFSVKLARSGLMAVECLTEKLPRAPATIKTLATDGKHDKDDRKQYIVDRMEAV